MESTCPSCKFTLSPDWFFCPNCGKQLKEKVPQVTVSKQILIYSVSFFLAPLGLGWGLKYIFSQDAKVRLIGWTSIILTFISLMFLFFTFKSVADQYLQQLNRLGLM